MLAWASFTRSERSAGRRLAQAINLAVFRFRTCGAVVGTFLARPLTTSARLTVPVLFC